MPDLPDSYDVLPLSVNIFEVVPEGFPAHHFVAAYFPAALLKRMNWTRETPLELIVDGETLIVSKKELTYELEPEAEPTFL